MLNKVTALITGLSLLVFASWASNPSSAAAAYPARSSNSAGVRVVVTPKVLGAGVKVWEFEVSLDTHTKPLDENLAQIAALVDEAGRRYTAVSWQGDPPGGHHRKGTLRFNAPNTNPSVIELQIEGIGGSGARTFRWELK